MAGRCHQARVTRLPPSRHLGLASSHSVTSRRVSAAHGGVRGAMSTRLLLACRYTRSIVSLVIVVNLVLCLIDTLYHR